ncbi:MAG: hypothetical protein AB7K52_05925 [Phycisphaerales bacterium]
MGTLVQVVLLSYVLIGIAFAGAFAWRGAGVLDPAARGAPLGFRLFIAPAAAALWPVLGVKWIRARRTSRAVAGGARAGSVAAGGGAA